MIFLRNLMRTKVRSLLTLLGVSVGTAVFVGVATLTLDMQQQFAHSTAAYNTEVMIRSAHSGTPFRSRITPGQIAELEARLQQTVSPMVTGMVALPGGGTVPLLGIAEQSLGIIPVVGGKTLRPAQPELLVGVLLAEFARLRVGSKIVLGDADFTVAGHFRSGGRYLDGGIITGLEQARRILGRGPERDDYNLAMVQTGDQNTTARVLALVREHFPTLRAETTVEFSGVLQIMRTMEVSSWTVAMIALLGAAIVVANTLVMVVSERTRELGVLVSIGWTPWLVLRMLFAEIAALCLAGTLLGNGAAQGLLWLLAQLHPAGYGWSLPTVIAPLATAASGLAALVIALIAMFWPAHVVYRLKPAQALRHG